MISRILILLIGAGLMALALLLYRPDIYDMAPVSLGDYESYRLFLIVAAGWMGAVIFISAILRRTYPRPEYAITAEALEPSEPAPEMMSNSGGGGRPSPQPLW